MSSDTRTQIILHRDTGRPIMALSAEKLLREAVAGTPAKHRADEPEQHRLDRQFLLREGWTTEDGKPTDKATQALAAKVWPLPSSASSSTTPASGRSKKASKAAAPAKAPRGRRARGAAAEVEE